MIYSTSFYDAVVTGAGASHALWTVPAGFVDVVRDIDIYTSFGAADAAFFGTAANRYLWWLLPGAGPSQHWSGRQVHAAGDALTLFPVSGPIHLKVSGYRLSA